SSAKGITGRRWKFSRRSEDGRPRGHFQSHHALCVFVACLARVDHFGLGFVFLRSDYLDSHDKGPGRWEALRDLELHVRKDTLGGANVYRYASADILQAKSFLAF